MCPVLPSNLQAVYYGMKTYRIKEGYLHKDMKRELPNHEGYWTPARIYASNFHQYQVYQFAGEIIAKHGVASVLDVGCGPGTKLAILHEAFPNVSYFGVDLSEAIEYCRKTYRFGTWLVEDFNQNGGRENPAGKVDLVICSDVIEHVADPDVLLKYLKSAVAPNGYIVISTPERDILNGPESLSAPNAYHVREWNYEEIREYVTEMGFKVERHDLQLPVRIWPNMIFYREIVRRAFAGRPLKYNQVLLLRPT